MQTSVSGSIERIRYLLGDTNPNNRLVSLDALKRFLEEQALAFAAEIPVNRQTQTITLTSGNYQCALDSTAIQYRTIDRVVDDERRMLRPVTLETLLMHRRTNATGRPRMYAVEESGSGVVTLDFYPTPDSAYAFTVYYQEFPILLAPDGATLSGGGSVSEGVLSIGTTWAFDEPTVRALEKSVALRILAITPNEELMKRGLSKDIMPLWSRDVEQAKSQARIRIARQRRTSSIEMWGA